MEKDLIYSLLVFIGIRELLFMWQLNKLTNKLMSRNYHEYTVSQQAGKLLQQDNQKFKVDDELSEDFNQLAGIG